MKKLIAVCLTLLLCLGTALAEDAPDVAGTWYVTFIGVVDAETDAPVNKEDIVDPELLLFMNMEQDWIPFLLLNEDGSGRSGLYPEYRGMGESFDISWSVEDGEVKVLDKVQWITKPYVIEGDTLVFRAKYINDETFAIKCVLQKDDDLPSAQ